MTTREDLLKYADRRMKEQRKKGLPAFKPIYEIMLFEFPNKKQIIGDQEIDYPNIGAEERPGYFYSVNDAVDAMHKNTLFMSDGIYLAGFVSCKFPGIYDAIKTDCRFYFKYDPDRRGFYEEEEPEIFHEFAF